MSGRRGLNLSAAQIIASVLATLSAAVAASFLGVAGTLIGAALGSVVSTMGTEIYKHYLQRSEERLRSAGQVLYHSAARTGTGSISAQAGAASGGRHAAYQGSAGQQGVTRELGNRDEAGQDPANQDTAVWDRRQYGTPRDSPETQTIPGFGTEWAGAANGGVSGSSPNGGAANGGASNGWDGSGNSAGQHAHGSITPEGADGDAAGRGSLWAAITSFFAGLSRRQWLTYGGIAAVFFIIVIAGIIVFQLAAGRPVLGSPASGHTSHPQQQQTTHPSSTPSATPTGSTPASPTSSASPTSGTPTSGTPTPSTSVGSTSPSAVPSATPTTGSSGAAQSKPTTQATPTP
jgi:hypothetical protein